MLGGFITRGLVMVLGYAYPAFECFKAVEKNKVEIEELLFWCHYWIIIAVLTIFERIVDMFVSWLPLYGEMKLALIIFLWYPKTKGSGYVYKTFLRPYMAKHEPDIDRSIQEWKARAWDLVISHGQNVTKMGQTTFFQMLNYLIAQSAKLKNASTEKSENQHAAATPTPTPATPASPDAQANRASHRYRAANSDKRRQSPLPPSPPPRTASSQSLAQTPRATSVQVHLHSEAKFVRYEDEPVVGTSGSNDPPETGVDHSLHAARLRLRRSDSKGLH